MLRVLSFLISWPLCVSLSLWLFSTGHWFLGAASVALLLFYVAACITFFGAE